MSHCGAFLQLCNEQMFPNLGFILVLFLVTSDLSGLMWNTPVGSVRKTFFTRRVQKHEHLLVIHTEDNWSSLSLASSSSSIFIISVSHHWAVDEKQSRLSALFPFCSVSHSGCTHVALDTANSRGRLIFSGFICARSFIETNRTNEATDPWVTWS